MMRILPAVEATPEQLTILADNRAGTVLIRGAAGSGKTTTALMRLRQLCAAWQLRRTRLGLTAPVRVLVLTYNRTLEGYIEALAALQIQETDNLQLNVTTFGKFSSNLLGYPDILDSADANSKIATFGAGLGLDRAYLCEEVDYLLGRFAPDDLESYVTARRDGRGIAPRVDASLRRRLLDEVVAPYVQFKADRELMDWNDVAVRAGQVDAAPWDVVVVDETQDFSANQIRTIRQHLAVDHSLTFVMDAAQRIYPRAFTWREVGITPGATKTLAKNYRNTRQIAAFARPLVEGLTIGDDGALPNLDATAADGPLPLVVTGTYAAQVRYMLEHVVAQANLAEESVAFLQPRGGGWFTFLKGVLNEQGIPWVELTRSSVWPGGDETVALSTLHSAKGLEFDHVIIPGLNQEVTPHGIEAGDGQLDDLRRLVAMGIGRARKSVTIGYKASEASSLVKYLAPGTFTEVAL
jgi:superfamily I DNA/RNA helicase